MERRFTVLAGLFGATGVLAGAFAAHALRTRLSPELLAVFETGARYHLLHALALLGAARAATRFPGRAAAVSGLAFTVGIVLFSGSLYALALTSVRWLGAVTPFGGVAFVVGWLALVSAALRTNGAETSTPP